MSWSFATENYEDKESMLLLLVLSLTRWEVVRFKLGGVYCSFQNFGGVFVIRHDYLDSGSDICSDDPRSCLRMLYRKVGLGPDQLS